MNSIDELLQKLSEVLGEEEAAEAPKHKTRTDAVLDVMEMLGAKESSKAIRTMNAARQIFALVCEIEYTTLAIISIRRGKSGSKTQDETLDNLMTDFPKKAVKILQEAGIKSRMDGQHLVVPQASLAIKTVFDFYQTMTGIALSLDDEKPPIKIEELLEQVEQYARVQLQAHGWAVHGEVLPSNMASHIIDMQNLN